MTTHLNPEDQQTVEALVASGRFSSVSEALHEAISLLDHEIKWTPDIQATIDEGVAAAARNDFADDAELDALFASYQRKSA